MTINHSPCRRKQDIALSRFGRDYDVTATFRSCFVVFFWGRNDFMYHSKFRRLWQKIISIFPRYISINHIRIVRTIFFFENYWNRWENQASPKMLHTHPVKTEDMFLHDSNALPMSPISNSSTYENKLSDREGPRVCKHWEISIVDRRICIFI